MTFQLNSKLDRQAGRAIIPALFALGVAIVVINAWLAFHSVEALLGDEHAVEHTWQVIYQVEHIQTSVIAAETGSRGFLLTGDNSYLGPYTEALQTLPADLDLLRRLTADNSVQQAKIEQLSGGIGQRLALLEHGIDLRRSGTASSALLNGGTGRTQMDLVRQITADMEAEERRLLDLRTAGAHSSSVRARSAVALASTLDLVLLVLAFRHFAQERRQRIATELAAEKLAISRHQIEVNAAEISALNATLEERVQLRTAELETTNRELEAFSYSVSHDLRAPLRTIDGFSLALEEDYADAVDEVGRDYIKRVRSGVQRMGQLIDALLQLSRITRAEIVREDFDLSDLARTVAANLRDENPGRDLDFRIGDHLTANGDPRLLQVALENLLGNAVKFSSKKVSTLVEFGWDKTQYAWFVRDNGAGFDMCYSEKLFNAFNRLHGDKDFKGSGIGLATVARVIRRHHGRIWADSNVDHGATFWFTLR